MPYSAEISRTNPSCFLFVIDQSGSMADPYGSEPGMRKADHLASAINNILANLVISCTRTEGVRDYFYVGVIGYGGKIGPAFGGSLAGKDLIPISEIANAPLRIEDRTKKVNDGAGGIVEQTVKFPIWFEAVSDNGTPMTAAISSVTGVLKQFLSSHPNSFPPVVMHFTDGESTDGDPTSVMHELTSLSTSDGNVVLFNVHLSSSSKPPIAFPQSPESLPDQYARMLFETASELTSPMQGTAKQKGYNVQAGAKAFAFNADSILAVESLEIGTRTPNLR